MQIPELEKLSFKLIGEISVRSNNSIGFNLRKDHDSTSQGWVYLWLIVERKGKIRIAYIGKAGKTIDIRCKQHERGFNEKRRPGVGVKTAQKIRTEISENRRKILVYARLSDRKRILEVPNVSMCEVEEVAAIQRWRPEWNRIFVR